MKVRRRDLPTGGLYAVGWRLSAPISKSGVIVTPILHMEKSERVSNSTWNGNEMNFLNTKGLVRVAIACTVGADLRVCPGPGLQITTGADTQVCPYADLQHALRLKGSKAQRQNDESKRLLSFILLLTL